VILPNGNTATCEELYEDCLIRMYKHKFLTDLYRFESTDFGVILGMDWLAKHQAQIECPRRKITLRGPNREKVVHKSKGPRVGAKLISVMKARKLLGRGCEGSLYNLVTTEGAEPSLEDIPAVRKFPDVFLEEIVDMPPLREVEFCIDLTPRATPISKALYHLAPVELKELKT